MAVGVRGLTAIFCWSVYPSAVRSWIVINKLQLSSCAAHCGRFCLRCSLSHVFPVVMFLVSMETRVSQLQVRSCGAAFQLISWH